MSPAPWVPLAVFLRCFYTFALFWKVTAATVGTLCKWELIFCAKNNAQWLKQKLTFGATGLLVFGNDFLIVVNGFTSQTFSRNSKKTFEYQDIPIKQYYRVGAFDRKQCFINIFFNPSWQRNEVCIKWMKVKRYIYCLQTVWKLCSDLVEQWWWMSHFPDVLLADSLIAQWMGVF